MAADVPGSGLRESESKRDLRALLLFQSYIIFYFLVSIHRNVPAFDSIFLRLSSVNNITSLFFENDVTSVWINVSHVILEEKRR